MRAQQRCGRRFGIPTCTRSGTPFVDSIQGEHAPGAERRCAVRVGRKVGETREHCTHFEEKRRILRQIDEDSTGFLRLVSDWTAGFALEPAGAGATRVTAQSVFVRKNPFLVLMLPMIRRKFHRTQQAILAGLKQFVETRPATRTVELETG